MSNRYKGGIISATPPTTNGPFEDGAASGAWTLEQQMQAAAAGTWPLAGNVSPDAFIENLFQTWLYTGNDAYQAINNGIDLAGKGGLVWSKSRSTSGGQFFYDSARGATTGNAKSLTSNTTAAQVTTNPNSMNFISSGFELASNASSPGNLNASGETAVSWTFRKQPKFFDVVTYTGNGSSSRAVPHNLGSTPGCVFVKATSTTSDWIVIHYGGNTSSARRLVLNSTAAAFSTGNDSTRTNDTTFSANNGLGPGGAYSWNVDGVSYVAYLFAHNAGGFGLTGTDNVISCGSYTGSNSAAVTVDLGYEPQWVMIKRANGSGSPAWWIGDTMRGLNMQGINRLEAWTSDAESGAYNGINPTATGFVLPYGTVLNDSASDTYIYIAIRRGPMKVPTDGTKVFLPQAYTGDGTSNRSLDSGFVDDFFMYANRALVQSRYVFDRLRGNSRFLQTNDTSAEALYVGTNGFVKFNSQQNGAVSGDSGAGDINTTSVTNIGYHFQRAPGFFDEVCYTGNSVSGTTQAHNLGVVPELRIVKSRTSADNWMVTGTFTTSGNFLNLESTDPIGNYGAAWRVDANATALTLGNASQVNSSGNTYVAYLFASAPGVSKVGSYTGTATTQTINCGFTGGARFVLIKRTDASGDWYVWDSARGIVAGDDPYLLLNSTAAEVTNTDYVDTAATGFEISSTAPAAINASGGTFVFLAIA